MVLAALVAVGTTVGLFEQKSGQVSRKRRAQLMGVLDARCLGGCTDSALLRILPTVPASQLATGQLATTKGTALTVARASNKLCTKGSAYFDPAQDLITPETWTGFATTNALAPVGATDPWGGSTAITLTDTAANAIHAVSRTSIATVMTSPHVASAYAKAGTAACLAIGEANTGAGCTFNLSTGVATAISGKTCTISGPDATGFYRISMGSATAGVASDGVYFGVNAPCSASAFPSYVGTGSTVVVASPKLEASTLATDPPTAYVQGNQQQAVTLGNNLACVESAGVLVEGAGTNLLLRSDEFDNAAWTKGVGSTVTANAAISPDGTGTAEKLALTAVNTALTNQAVTISASTTYTVSVWARSASGTMDFRLGRTNGGTWVTATVSPTLTATTTWQRFAMTYTSAGGEVTSDFTIGAEQKTPFVPTVGSMYIWRAQHELGPLATSGIATAGTSASRAADVVSIANPIPGSTFCMASTITPESGSAWNIGVTRRGMSLGVAAAANSTRLEWGDTNAYQYAYDNAGAAKTNTVGHSFTAGSSHRIITCNAAGTLTMSFDGVAQAPVIGGAGTGVITTQPGTLYLGESAGTSAPFAYLSDICVASAAGVCR